VIDQLRLYLKRTDSPVSAYSQFLSFYQGNSDRSSLTVVDAQAAEFHAFPLSSSLPSLSRLRAYLPRLLVQHVIIEPVAALCRLLQLQYRAVTASLTLTPDASHSGAPMLDGESIDLRDSIVETESSPDRSDYLEADGRFFGFRQLWRSERARQGH